jgi:hypothetical protein
MPASELAEFVPLLDNRLREVTGEVRNGGDMGFKGSEDQGGTFIYRQENGWQFGLSKSIYTYSCFNIP